MMKSGIFLHILNAHKILKKTKIEQKTHLKIFLIIFFGTKSAHNKIRHRQFSSLKVRLFKATFAE